LHPFSRASSLALFLPFLLSYSCERASFCGDPVIQVSSHVRRATRAQLTLGRSAPCRFACETIAENLSVDSSSAWFPLAKKLFAGHEERSGMRHELFKRTVRDASRGMLLGIAKEKEEKKKRARSSS